MCGGMRQNCARKRPAKQTEADKMSFMEVAYAVVYKLPNHVAVGAYKQARDMFINGILTFKPEDMEESRAKEILFSIILRSELLLNDIYHKRNGLEYKYDEITKFDKPPMEILLSQMLLCKDAYNYDTEEYMKVYNMVETFADANKVVKGSNA